MRIKKTFKKEKQVANQQLVKETNLTLVFSLINQYGPISRAELAQITRLSPTTVSSLTEELLNNEMIIETGMGATATSGRKPIMLEVNPDGGYVASIEMVEDGFNFFLYDLKCRELAGMKLQIPDYNTIGEEIVKTVDKVFANRNISEDKLLGICLGIPGLIDADNKRVVSSTVIPIDENNDFYYKLKKRFNHIPILMGNESCFSAYAEKEFGANGDIKNLVFIDINKGIGSGIILDGRIFTGSFGLAGEIGHMSIDMNGPKCICGNRGCLEIMASIPAMSQRIIFAMMSGRDTLIRDIVSNDFNKVNVDVIKKAMDNKDELVLEVVDEAAARLAFGINNIINIINPEIVVLGGEIVKLGKDYLDKVRSNVLSLGFKPCVNKVDIKYSSLQGNTVTLGGAKYVLDNIFKTPGLFSNNSFPLWTL